MNQWTLPFNRLIFLIPLLALVAAPTTAEAQPFIRGDVNADGIVDFADGVFLINYLELDGAPPPAPLDRADVNDDEYVNFTDFQYLQAFLFCGGTAPPPPNTPGSDPNNDLKDFDPDQPNPDWDLRAVWTTLTPTLAVAEIRIGTPVATVGHVAGTLEFDPALSAPSFTPAIPQITVIEAVLGNRFVFRAFGDPADGCSFQAIPGGVDVLVGTVAFTHDGTLTFDPANPPFSWIIDPAPHPILDRPTISASLEDHTPTLDPFPGFIRGDVNDDGLIGVPDLLYLLNYMLVNGPPPPLYTDRADVNDNEAINLTDFQYLAAFLFCGGTPPPAPFPAPGPDPDNDLRGFDPDVPDPDWTIRSNLRKLGATAELDIFVDAPVAFIQQVTGTIGFDNVLANPVFVPNPALGGAVMGTDTVSGNRMSFFAYGDPTVACSFQVIPGSSTRIGTIVFDVVGNLVCDPADPPYSWIANPGNSPPLARASIAANFIDHTPVLQGRGCAEFIRGDFDGNEIVEFADVLALLNYLLLAGPPPVGVSDVADVNDNESVNLTDAQYALLSLFCLGPPIPAPFPSPGLDPNDNQRDFDPNNPNPNWELRAVWTTLTPALAVAEIRVTTPVNQVAHVGGTLAYDTALSNPVFTPAVAGVVLGGQVDLLNQVYLYAYGDPSQACDIEALPGGSDVLIGTVSFTHDGSLMFDPMNPPFAWNANPVNDPPLGRAVIAANLIDHTPTLSRMPGDLFVRGDCNNDGSIDVGDGVYALGALFPPPGTLPLPTACVDACDGNDDGNFDIGDAISILSALFGQNTIPLPPPFPVVDAISNYSQIWCGVDPSGDPLDCASFNGCP